MANNSFKSMSKPKSVVFEIHPSKAASHVTHIVNVYRKMAKNYDTGEFLRIPFRKMTVKMAEVKPKDKVLDICTGTGEVAAWFAREGANVTGIDLSPDMLVIAKTKYPSITFKIMDASKLNFPDESFDVVNVQLGLHDLPIPLIKKTLAEMRRVSRRTVIILEPQAPKNRFLKVLFRYLMFSEFFEASDWKGYTHLDLRKEIQNADLKIESERSLRLGLLRFYKCKRDS